jgi:hypothetical protein
MPTERIVSVSKKNQLCNYGSGLAHVVHGPGLNELQYASGRRASHQTRQAAIGLLPQNGDIIWAKVLSCEWKPYAITAEFEFPGGLRVSQRSWVEDPFIHSVMTFHGDLPAGTKLVADGASYGAASKILVSPQGTILLDCMDLGYKPMVLEIASSVKPNRVELREDGSTYKETDYIWTETKTAHYRMIFDKLPREMTVSAHLSMLSDFVEPEEWERSRKKEGEVRRDWEQFYADGVPTVDCPDQRYHDLVQYCFYVHRSNMMHVGGMLPGYFACPSKMFYPAWWMWDTGFHSVIDAWMKDPSLAFGNLLSHASLQTRAGCVPDAGGPYLVDTGNLEWVSPEQYEDFPPPCSGPPMTGIAAWDVYQKTGSLDFVKRFYPHLVMYERWITKEKNSKLDPDLMAYYNWCDIGWDDTKRFGKGGFVESADWDFPVVPVDANVYLVILLETLSKFSKLLGENDMAQAYAEKAAKTRKAIDRWMWSEPDGFYFDVLPDGKKIDVWSPAGFYPMMIDLPAADSYQRMRAHLLDPKKFWAEYPVPTLALDDKDVMTVDGGWRGGVWPQVNWHVCESLFHYDAETALRLVDKTVNMMVPNGQASCWEFHNPLTGEGRRAVDNGFSAMPIQAVLQRVFGLNPHPTNLELKPHLQPEWPDASVQNVFAGGTSLNVDYVRVGVEITAKVKNTGSKAIGVTSGPNKLHLEPGQEGNLQIAIS